MRSGRYCEKMIQPALAGGDPGVARQGHLTSEAACLCRGIRPNGPFSGHLTSGVKWPSLNVSSIETLSQ